jgi:hypothetical protein
MGSKYIGENIMCNYENNYCKFPTVCSAVTTLNMEHININLNDGAGNAMNMKISHQDLLVDGTTFGDPNTCYFGIFRSSLADT